MQTRICKLALSVVAVYLVGCIPQSEMKKQNSSSLLASTEGFAKEDLEFLKPENIALHCKAADDKNVVAKPLRLSDKAMEFPGEQLADGMSCYLEVRAPLNPAMEYTWLGIGAENKPEVGLFYMSEVATIEGGKLILSIVKLYSVKPSDSFKLSLMVYFNGSDALADESNSEQYRVPVSAEITCRVGEETVKHRSLPGAQIPEQPRVRSFLFSDLSVSRLKTASCHKVSVYEGNTTLVYEADRLAPPLLFVQAEVGSTINMSVRVDKVVEPEPFTRVEMLAKCVQQNDDGRCLRYELPHQENIWVAEAILLDRSNNTSRRVFVTAKDGLAPNNHKYVDVAGMNLDLAKFSGPTTYHFYKEMAGSTLLAKTFDDNTAASLGVMRENFLLPSVSGVEIQFILGLHVHAMHPANIETQRLSSAGSQAERWLATVDLRANGRVRTQFVVSGAKQYFESARLPSGKLFDWGAFVNEVKSNQLGQNYSVYVYGNAVRGQMTAGCGTPLAQFIDKPATLLPQEMSYEQPELGYCRVSSFPVEYLEGYEPTVRFYLYGWHRY